MLRLALLNLLLQLSNRRRLRFDTFDKLSASPSYSHPCTAAHIPAEAKWIYLLSFTSYILLIL